MVALRVQSVCFIMKIKYFNVDFLRSIFIESSFPAGFFQQPKRWKRMWSLNLRLVLVMVEYLFSLGLFIQNDAAFT